MAGDCPVPPPASEPPPPGDVAGNDELYIIGLHLAEYRHATRSPTEYWREACGAIRATAAPTTRWGFGTFAAASSNKPRSTSRGDREADLANANPYDGEPLYHLGLCLLYQRNGTLAALHRSKAYAGTLSTGEESAVAQDAIDLADLATRLASIASTLGRLTYRYAYAAFAKAAWSRNTAPAALLALAEMDCREEGWEKALDHLDAALRMDTEILFARNLKAIVLRKLNRPQEAETLLRETLSGRTSLVSGPARNQPAATIGAIAATR